MLIDIADKFVTACSPVIDSNFDTCGSLTKASIDHLSKDDLATLFKPGGLYADLDAWFHHSLEMKACGVRRFGWYDWIMANTDRTMYTAAFRNAIRPGVRAVKGPSLLHPWIMGRQDSHVTRDYWKLNNSIATGGYTINQPGNALGTMTGGPLTALTGGTAVLRLTNNHNLPLDADWFRSREILHVFTTTAGVSQMGSWKVVAAVATATYIDVLVTGENAGSDSAFFNFASGGASGKQGVLIPGINNVNDYESWCQNLPTVNPKKMVPFWYQTYRDTSCVDAEYKEIYRRLWDSNAAFREFEATDLAEINRQREHERQRRFVHAFFFQKPISANQTLSLWESLEDISTLDETSLTIKPGLGGRLKAKRANWVGVREQLHVCARVKDMQGNPLNLLEFFQINYDIKRARTSQGRKVDELVWHTNEPYREKFHQAMISYYNDFYGNKLVWNVEVGKETDLGMIYDRYKVGFPGGIWITIISDEFFDDWRSEHEAAGQAEVGNLLLNLDIGKPGTGTIYYAQLATNRKQMSTASIEELGRLDPTFRCAMETTSIDQTLYSETGAPIVECPLNSLWIENLGTIAPITTGMVAPYSDLI